MKASIEVVTTVILNPPFQQLQLAQFYFKEGKNINTIYCHIETMFML